ncbi:glutathione transferase GstA [Ectopseudomonas mendocina]|uniref:Glutathione S-transferase n=1 Tax=Ectopseudomonas mendocina S5.2 TaxID=1225174 RepID=A0ABM5VSE1_ECTME|nr:glutathione transferase GstA [Pseudomonas mendocina]ALN17729.1 glutathione S-transferase [Pseudomonas mendocina S5.2]KES01457.1 glutathione S-transferase [Pseudomonas mendocina]VEE17444.1 glutathione S-transferase domain-containing protein [Pseudomonas mendocina]
MKLYYKAGACSLSPHIALREAGLPFELEAVDLKTKLTASGEDFIRINGKGYIPALQLDNGKVLTEGAAIVQYIADLKPESGLAPANGSEARYELQSWLSFISSELHKPFGSMFNPAQSADWKAAAQALLSKRLDWLVTELGEREFLLGDRFTVADGYLFTVLGWAGMVGFSLDPWPSLQAYHARIGARPKVIEALKAEGLI